jgi:transposase, IS5 family
MFKILILQAQHNLSDARMEYMIRDRLSWMRFLGLRSVTAPPTRTPSGTFATG